MDSTCLKQNPGVWINDNFSFLAAGGGGCYSIHQQGKWHFNSGRILPHIRYHFLICLGYVTMLPISPGFFSSVFHFRWVFFLVFYFYLLLHNFHLEPSHFYSSVCLSSSRQLLANRSSSCDSLSKLSSVFYFPHGLKFTIQTSHNVHHLTTEKEGLT